MSVGVMSAIFKTEFRDLQYTKDGEIRNAKASTCKLLLLAIADNANEEGYAYPGYTKLELKTALSRQGISDTLEALRQNGIIQVSDSPSKLGTNEYSIQLSSFPCLSSRIIDESSHLTTTSQATLPALVKPLDLNHQLTTIKPKERDNEKFAKIAKELSTLQGGGLKTTDADYLKEWEARHTAKWILKAIEIARDKGARSSAYVDRILVGWEANGYPKTREELVKERKARSKYTPHQQVDIDAVLGLK